MSLSAAMTVNKSKDTNQVLFTDKVVDLLLSVVIARFNVADC